MKTRRELRHPSVVLCTLTLLEAPRPSGGALDDCDDDDGHYGNC